MSAAQDIKPQDPTRRELLRECVRFLKPWGLDKEGRTWATWEGIYWFAYAWHGGQYSNLYSVLSTCPFRPGPIANKPQDFFAVEVVEHLEKTFCGGGAK